MLEVRISKQGIFFSYYGDELLWIWPWRQDKTVKFFSPVFQYHFATLRDYWMHVGAWNESLRKEKVIGYTEKELLFSWARRFNHDTVVILRNINVEVRSTPFWKSVDIYTKKELLKDVVVLFFRNPQEASRVFYSIEPEFAEAYLFVKGELLSANNDNNYKSEQDTSRSNYPGPV